jgi:hypothetical protein
MVFSKNDLRLNHYKWQDSSQGFVFAGEPTRRMFDRFNGSQVLFIINSYASVIDRFTAQIGEQIEELISNYLPLDKKSEISVFNWINENIRIQKIIN